MILNMTRRVVIVYVHLCLSMFVCLYIEFVCIHLTRVLMFVCSLHHACVSMFVRTTHWICTRRIVCSVQQSGAWGKIGWKGCVWASQSHLLCICICKLCVRFVVYLLWFCACFVPEIYNDRRSHVLYLYLYCIVFVLCVCFAIPSVQLLSTVNVHPSPHNWWRTLKNSLVHGWPSKYRGILRVMHVFSFLESTSSVIPGT